MRQAKSCPFERVSFKNCTVVFSYLPVDYKCNNNSSTHFTVHITENIYFDHKYFMAVKAKFRCDDQPATHQSSAQQLIWHKDLHNKQKTKLLLNREN